MSEPSDFSRRDILGTGAMLAGAALTAGMLSSCTSAQRRGEKFSLTPVRDQAPLRPLGENAQVRLGCIGIGGRGNHLMHAAMSNEGVTVKAVCDLKPQRLQAAADTVQKIQGHVPDRYGDDEYAYRKILMRDDIDAVIIATPCYLHTPMYVDCAKYKKNFYGEKPAAISVEQANELVAKVPPAGIVAQIGFQRRTSPRYQKEIKMLKEGVIGEFVDARGAWDNAFGPLRGWLGDRSRSGDWMLEQACHTWDVFNWVNGELPTAAYGVGRKDIYVDPVEEPNRDVTDFYFALIQWPGMDVRYSQAWGLPNSDLFCGVYERVIGKTGAIDLESGKILFRDKDKEPITVEPDEKDQTYKSIGSFIECVRTGTEPQSTVFVGRDASLTGLLVRKAVDEERVVTMNEIV